MPDLNTKIGLPVEVTFSMAESGKIITSEISKVREKYLNLKNGKALVRDGQTWELRSIGTTPQKVHMHSLVRKYELA